MQTAVTEHCPHVNVCGGCSFGTASYEDMKALKESRVKHLLAPSFSLQKKDVHWEEILASPAVTGYRNKMEFTFGDAKKDGPLELGLHQKGRFHDIVSVTDCRIVDEDFRRILRTTLSYFSAFYEKKEITYYHRKRAAGYLRHLLVRKAHYTGEILVVLVTTSANDDTLKTNEQALLQGFTDALLHERDAFSGTLHGILHTVNDAKSDAIVDQGTAILYGTDTFEERLLSLRFTISPFSFFQTNSASAEVLYETVRRYVDEALRDAGSAHVKQVFDLYCGTGTITQLLSSVADQVTGVELNEEAVLAARAAAKKNGIENCTFICGDVLQVLDALTDQPDVLMEQSDALSERPDVLILDPPRAGLHPKTLPKLVSCGASHIIYVSCKPESLARDLPFFLMHGYEAVKAVCLDQFPWTDHTEVILRLSRV